MGQTLNHGVYLPAEGERNCYSGLASNWNLLDTAIGDIAGKASASHSHGNITNDGKVGTAANKPLITGTGGAIQAGSFGNQANTFCEGNDSRLSDARTPVAHTHGKADVTDLLNSNFIPSANNSYDLGSSSYQWNNLYAKSYYYNGTAWGLDKDNTWTGNNTFSDATNCVLSFKFGSGSYSDIRYYDSNNSNYACLRSKVTDLALGLKYSSASNWYDGASVVIRNDGNVQIKSYDGTENWTVNFTPVGVYPTSDKTLELGTSTHKWKTLNGINPGALSLPDNSNYTNISGNITDLTGSVNSYTPPFDGYVMVNVNPNSNNYAYVSIERVTVRSSSETTSGKNAMATISVIGGKSIDISVIGASIAQARFTPCLGNV